jgi:hypothetical protein
MRHIRVVVVLGIVFALAISVRGQTKPRARDLGIPFDGVTGRFNAITDVAGVEVGLTTLISGKGPLVVGKGPVRRALPRSSLAGKRC